MLISPPDAAMASQPTSSAHLLGREFTDHRGVVWTVGHVCELGDSASRVMVCREGAARQVVVHQPVSTVQLADVQAAVDRLVIHEA